MLARSIFALGCLVVLSLSDLAHPSTQRALKLATMVEKPDLIFVGTAVQTQSAWNAEHTRIYTRTTFEVEEYVKGGAGRAVVVEIRRRFKGRLSRSAPGSNCSP